MLSNIQLPSHFAMHLFSRAAWRARFPHSGSLVFQRSNFAEAPQMPLSLTEFSRQESLNQIPSEFRADNATAQTNNVHVIVLDALPRREMIFDQSCANARNLIGANRGAYTTAADGHAAHNFSAGNGTGEGNHEIRIIVLRVQREGPKIGDLMSRGAKLPGKLV